MPALTKIYKRTIKRAHRKREDFANKRRVSNALNTPIVAAAAAATAWGVEMIVEKRHKCQQGDLANQKKPMPSG